MLVQGYDLFQVLRTTNDVSKISLCNFKRVIKVSIVLEICCESLTNLLCTERTPNSFSAELKI